MTERRIGRLDTLEKCRHECARLYRAAWKGEILWADAEQAAAVLEMLSSMIAANSDKEHGEAPWSNVGKNALRG